MSPSIQKLLGVVWGKKKGYVFFPSKNALDPDYPKRGWYEAQAYRYDGTSSSIDLNGLPEHSDLYWCVNIFSKPRRVKENALPSRVLWADLDPVHPTKCRLMPSITWESSPGRYQALWLLDEEVAPDEAAELSKRIAYGDDADKGGWDLTQVLRLPNSINYKYDMKPQVGILWAKNLRYSPSQVRAAYPPVDNGSNDKGSGTTSSELWPSVEDGVIQTAILSLPLGLRRRLSQSTAGADRSTELQKLSRDLLRWGLSSDIVSHLLQRSTWNKFSGRSDEHSQLLKQVSSAIAAVGSPSEPTTIPQLATASAKNDDAPFVELTEMKVQEWGAFLSIPTRLKWLVEDSWVDRTVGFISGPSKSFKTWIALDLALSVLSGMPFLARHPVARTGPVLLIQEEDPSAILQERLRLIAKAKNMLPTAVATGKYNVSFEFPEYPLHIINLQGFNLQVDEKVAQVRRLIGELNPIMVLIDPLINIIGELDENKATEVIPQLMKLKQWREDFGCNVVVVHHWNKMTVGEGDRGGHHMYGSFASHAWLESALHVSPVIDPAAKTIDTVNIEREFKAAAGMRSESIRFTIDSVADYTYQVEMMGTKVSELGQKVLDYMLAEGGIHNTGAIVTGLGYPRPTIVAELGRLVRHGHLVFTPGGGRGKQNTYMVKEGEATGEGAPLSATEGVVEGDADA